MLDAFIIDQLRRREEEKRREEERRREAELRLPLPIDNEFYQTPKAREEPTTIEIWPGCDDSTESPGVVVIDL